MCNPRLLLGLLLLLLHLSLAAGCCVLGGMARPQATGEDKYSAKYD
jgi:hypothetical protein